MVSFRVEEDDLAAADRWAEELGIERSELLREALASHLARLAVAIEADAFDEQPFTSDEASLDDADDWGPAEDWSDWAAWADRRDHATR